MRKPGYYWAGSIYSTDGEIVYYIRDNEIYKNDANKSFGSKFRSYCIGDFEWISNNLINPEKPYKNESIIDIDAYNHISRYLNSDLYNCWEGYEYGFETRKTIEPIKSI